MDKFDHAVCIICKKMPIVKGFYCRKCFELRSNPDKAFKMDKGRYEITEHMKNQDVFIEWLKLWHETLEANTTESERMQSAILRHIKPYTIEAMMYLYYLNPSMFVQICKEYKKANPSEFKEYETMIQEIMNKEALFFN